MGPYVSVPRMPNPTSNSGDYLPVVVNIRPFKDMRLLERIEQSENITPEGDVSDVVTGYLESALKTRGVTFDSSSPITLTGEIRTWSAEARGSSTGELKSEATVYVEVIQSGLRKFSGTYQGARSSQFPIVTPQDISDSLGLAMSQAIDQAISDSSLRRALADDRVIR
ncbi:MAG TPA: YajG family lipoprotein [Oligoflexia bacterium]|nr:YajG family lipoprotein [Oligoflexia bacterium]HMP48463.1 YajG family lipoprotein [Oligoflexia bacterium]